METNANNSGSRPKQGIRLIKQQQAARPVSASSYSAHSLLRRKDNHHIVIASNGGAILSQTGRVTVSPNGKPHKKKKSKPLHSITLHHSEALEGSRNFNMIVKPPMTSKGHHVRTAASSSNSTTTH